MKLIQKRRELLFINFLLTLLSVTLTYFFTNSLLYVGQILGIAFLLLIILLVISPAGKKTIPSATHLPFYTQAQRWYLWICLQLSVFLILLALFTAMQNKFGSNDPAPLIAATHFYLVSGFLPWSFYFLAGLTFAYFSSQTQHSLIYATLTPWVKEPQNAILIGSRFYLKQSSIVGGAATLSLLMGQLSTALSPHTSNAMFATVIVNALIFMLLASKIWRRASYYFWAQRYPIPVFFTINIGILTLAFTCFNWLFSWLTRFFPPITQPNLTLSWPNQAHAINQSLLFLLFWGILSTLLVAAYLVRLIQGQTLRSAALQAFSLPGCLALAIGLDHSLWHASGTIWLSQQLTQPWLIVGLMLATLSLVVAFFRDLDSLTLLQTYSRLQTTAAYPSLKTIRGFMLLLLGLLMLYFLTGMPFIILLISITALPILLLISFIGVKSLFFFSSRPFS